MPTITQEALINEIQSRAADQDRFLVAIAGAPGSGKSTLAAGLAARLGVSAAVLPMDGFHLENDQLQRMGLMHRKGAPETFDAESFVKLLRNVRRKGAVPYPTFDREADRTIANGGRIAEDTRIVLVEGNYLLLKTPPWSDLAGLFDLTVRLQVSRTELETRLISRWLEYGLPPKDARARALNNDMRNVGFVEENSRGPDYTLETG